MFYVIRREKTVMKRYLLCLSDDQLDFEIGEQESEVLNNLETMLDNLVNLLKDYGIEDEEIENAISEDTTIKLVDRLPF